MAGLLILPACGRSTEPSRDGSPAGANPEEALFIQAVRPRQSVPGQHLRLTVTGSGFETGLTLSVERADAPNAVVVDSITLVTPDSIFAFVSVSASAPRERYNVVARTPRGRKGIGTEKFEVVLVEDHGPGAGVAVNSAGTMVGYRAGVEPGGGSCTRFFRYSALSGSVVLRGPHGEECGPTALAINEPGMVVGSSSDEGPVFWTGGVDATPLLPPGMHLGGTAQDVNDAGVVVGTAGQLDPSSDFIRPAAFCWKDGRAVIIDLPRPLIGSTARRVNGAGDAVGWASPDVLWGAPSEAAVPMVYRCGLPSPVAVPLALPTGATSGIADVIDEQGTIYGFIKQTGERRWVRWRVLGPGVWGPAEPLPPELPGRVTAVTRSGRIVGMYYATGPLAWEERTWVHLPGGGTFDVSGIARNARALDAADDGLGGTLRLAGRLDTPTYSGIAYWPNALFGAAAIQAVPGPVSAVQEIRRTPAPPNEQTPYLKPVPRGD